MRTLERVEVAWVVSASGLAANEEDRKSENEDIGVPAPSDALRADTLPDSMRPLAETPLADDDE